MVLLGVAAILIAATTGLLADLASMYRAPSPYDPGSLNDFWFYHFYLDIHYPTLWPLVALAVLIGLAYRPGPTAFCATIVAIAFLAHSFAGRKSMRYFAYALPFLFVLWGIALAEIWPRLRRFLEDVATRALGWLRLGSLGRAGVYAALAVVIFSPSPPTALSCERRPECSTWSYRRWSARRTGRRPMISSAPGSPMPTSS